MNYIHTQLPWFRTHLFFDDLAEYQTPRTAPHSAAEFFTSLNNNYSHSINRHITKGGVLSYCFV
jgi:hypothetical protein